jgi:hypothetical protein
MALDQSLGGVSDGLNLRGRFSIPNRLIMGMKVLPFIEHPVDFSPGLGDN